MSISTTPTCHTRRSKDGRPLTKCIFLKVPRCQNNSKRPESLQGKHGENRIWLNDAIPVSPKRKLSQSIQRKPIPPNRNYRSKRRRAQKTNCLSFRNVTQNQVQNHPSNAIPSEEIPNSNRKIDLSRQLRTLPCISKTNCRVLVHKTPECLGRMHGKKILLLDRDTKFTLKFREHLKAAGTEPIRLPPKSPNCNAFIERFFRSLKTE